MPLVHVQMAGGRTLAQKQALLAAITDDVVEHLDAPRASVRVWITEFEANEYMAGGTLLSERRSDIDDQAVNEPAHDRERS